MKEFLISNQINFKFELFGSLHTLISFSVIIGLILIYIKREVISNLSEKTKRKISFMIILIMFLNMKVYYISRIIYGVYDWKSNLPLHFCFISNYLFIISVLFKNKNMYKIIYFFAFLGPLPAMIWPDLQGGIDVFVFYQFYISHHLFLISNMFIFYAYDSEFHFKDLIKAFKMANMIFLIVFVFNFIFKTNYIMQRSLPNHIMELYPFLYKINNPILILEITGVIVILISYIPIYLKNKRKKLNDLLKYA